MKKNLFLVLAVAAIAGCQKTDIAEQAVPETSPIQIVASIPATKTTVEKTETGLKTSWVKDDAVGLYWYRNSTTITDVETGAFAQRNQKAVANETGEVTTFNKPYYFMDAANVDYLLYGYYPYNASAGDNPLTVTISVPEVQRQTEADNTEHLGTVDFIYGSTVARWSDYPATETKKVDLSFHHALSVLDVALSTKDASVVLSQIRVTLDDENENLSVSEGTVSLADGSIAVTSGTPQMVLTVKKGEVLTSDAKNFYMAITPGHAGKTFSVYVTLNGVESLAGQMKVPATGIPAGVNARKSFEVSAPAVEYTDLSAGATANCYLITATGNYKFNAAVKGNGSIPAGMTTIETSTRISPKSALVLWYNTVQTSNSWVDNSPVLVSSVRYEDGYVYFSTPSDFVPGNVVIAAFAEEGLTYESITADADKTIDNATLLWSWNIWAAEGYNPESGAITAGDYTFMDRYVGAAISGLGTTGQYEPIGAVGNYYQWGRKDPIPAFPDYTSVNPDLYGNVLFCTPTYTPIAALQINAQGSAKNLNGQMFGYKTSESGAMQTNECLNRVLKTDISADSPAANKIYVDYAVSHPYKLIVGEKLRETGDYTWLNTTDVEYKSLWGTSKTLYDPCPAGWRICSKTEAESFLAAAADVTVSENNCGAENSSLYIPLNSYRDYSTFRLVDTVQSNYYTSTSQFWTCTFQDYYKWSNFYTARVAFPSNYATSATKTVTTGISQNLNARAFNVRCVKE